MLKKLFLVLMLASGLLCNIALAKPSAPYEPRQVNVKDFKITQKGPYTITGKALFSMTAQVLSTKAYQGSAREDQLSPLDFAVGWGEMSDKNKLSLVRVSQRDRFFIWSSTHQKDVLARLRLQSTNMHMIPSSPAVEQQLRSVKAGNVIAVQGYLVSISARDGFWWNSSLVRNDTGNGACEIVYVVSLKILG